MCDSIVEWVVPAMYCEVQIHLALSNPLPVYVLHTKKITIISTLDTLPSFKSASSLFINHLARVGVYNLIILSTPHTPHPQPPHY